MSHCKTRPIRLLAAALLGAALPAQAQSMKPGLWEISSQMTGAGMQFSQAMAQMQKQLASMPPEQRKAIEEMMARQAGVEMPAMRDGAMVLKVCMTKEMIAQNQVPLAQEGNCTQKRSATSGNTIKMSFTCTNPRSSGDGIVQFKGDTAYTMRMNMATTVAGKKEATSVDAAGKWLGADCGAIRPLAMPPAAAAAAVK